MNKPTRTELSQIEVGDILLIGDRWYKVLRIDRANHSIKLSTSTSRLEDILEDNNGYYYARQYYDSTGILDWVSQIYKAAKYNEIYR